MTKYRIRKVSNKELAVKAFALILGAFLLFAIWIAFFAMLDSSVANASTKYVKIKTTTYKKYQKAYKKDVPKLKKQVKTLTTQKNNTNKALAEVKADVDKYKSINNWLWDAFEDMGYHYDKNTKHWEATPDGNLCLECGRYFPLAPKGSPHYKFCPYCGSDNLE